MLAMFLGTNPLFQEPAIGFLDVLDLCGVLVLSACRKPTSGARTPTVFAMCPTAVWPYLHWNLRTGVWARYRTPPCVPLNAGHRYSPFACAYETSYRKFKNPWWSQLVFDSQHVCCTLTDDHAGSHGVAGCHAWHDRSIGDAKIVDAVDFEVAIHHTHSVPPHFGRGCLMPKAKRCVADVVF